ncbi:MAG: ABC transporter permease/substrate-binding protein [Bacteroidota bacterium]
MLKTFIPFFDSINQRHEYLFELLLQHIVLSANAIIIILITGLASGIFILYNPRFRGIILGTVNFLYTIPSIAMFGLFIPLVGIGYVNAMLVLVIYGLLPVIRNTFTGLNEVDPQLLDAAKAMGATPLQVFFRVRWPLAFPTIVSGFRTMVVMTIALAGLASFIGAGGLGQAIYRGINTNNASLILLGSISVAVLALIIDTLMGLFEKWVACGKKSNWGNRKTLSLIGVLAFLVLLWMVFPFLNTDDKNADRKMITVASKPTSEQYILAEIISQSVENKSDIQVVRKFGIGGGTSNIHPAMLKGEVDIYPEYTGTAWLFVLKNEKENDPEKLFSQLKNAYQQNFNLTWTGRLGFNNTFTLALPENIASENNISSFSQLAAQSDQFSFGAEFDFFEREDGFTGLVDFYGFDFQDVVELDVNLKYQAIDNNTVDVINAFSTDSRIEQLGLRVLEDDKNFFPAYQAGIVIRNQTLKRYPELRDILRPLYGQISEKDMLKMNYEVEIGQKSPDEVAADFLKKLK